MAITIPNSATYASASGSFLASHPYNGFDTSGTNPYLLIASFEKNPATEVTDVTADTVSVSEIDNNIFANVASIEAYGKIPADSSTDVVVLTPSNKECAFILANLNGVDQSTPFNSTRVKGNNFSTTATATVTGTAGSMLVVMVATQVDNDFTPSNCNELQDLQPPSGIGGCFMGYVEATGSAQTIGATIGAATNWRVLIIEFYAASIATIRRRIMIS